MTSRIKISDPEVTALISSGDSDLFDGGTGCQLAAYGVFESVQATRGWDRDTANLEYLRFLSESYLSGDLIYYSDSPVRSPSGPVVTIGKCADIPLMSEIKRSQALIFKNFDQFIRVNTTNVICEPGAVLDNIAMQKLADDLSDGENTNAWLSFQFQFIALGVGWYEGISSTEKGAPRPPLCHYE